MRSASRLSAVCALLLLALAAGCGVEAESASNGLPSPVQQAVNPLDTVPPERLYGATAEENILVTQAVIDVLDLPAGWDGMRIAALSDLQLGLWEGNDEVAARAVQRALETTPDLVVLLGDYIARGQDTLQLERVLSPLRGRPVMAVLGDRDLRTDSSEVRITRTLQRLGIRVLKNDVVPFQRRGQTGYIAGVDPDLIAKSAGDQEYILATMAPEGTRVPLLLAHHPPVAARVQTGRYPAILAGNTFCGQVEVPGTPRVSWLNSMALPGAQVPGVERLYLVKKNLLFVTCGVGYGFTPARLGAPPEVALVTLRRYAQPTAAAAQPDTIIPDSVVQRYQRRDSAGADTTARDTAR